MSEGVKIATIETCEVCNGKGYRIRSIEHDTVNTHTCTTCMGTGHIHEMLSIAELKMMIDAETEEKPAQPKTDEGCHGCPNYMPKEQMCKINRPTKAEEKQAQPPAQKRDDCSHCIDWRGLCDDYKAPVPPVWGEPGLTAASCPVCKALIFTRPVYPNECRHYDDGCTFDGYPSRPCRLRAKWSNQ